MATSEGLHKHAFWLYGVIVGLAVKAALEIVVPHLYSVPSDKMWDYSMETARLLIFLIVIVRFYLGSAYYFDTTYSGAGDERGMDVDYAIDFLFGFVHFLLFYAWALSIEVQGKDHRVFPVMMLVVLSYDVFWYFVGGNRGNKNLIRAWAFLNLATIVLVAAFYFSARALEISRPISQGLAFIPVAIISLIDISEVILRKRIIERAIKWAFEAYLLSRGDKEKGDGPGAGN